MGIQRIQSTSCHTAGWQARAHVAPGERLTKPCSDADHGGIDGSYGAALLAEQRLQRQVQVLLRQRAAARKSRA